MCRRVGDEALLHCERCDIHVHAACCGVEPFSAPASPARLLTSTQPPSTPPTPSPSNAPPRSSSTSLLSSLSAPPPSRSLSSSSSPPTWLCRRCSTGLPPHSTPCFVCGQSRGCFAPTDDPAHPWVHILCGVWMPGVSWRDKDTMDVLTNVSRIPSALWHARCAVCEEKVGCCYACAIPGGCPVRFHPTCAQQAGYEMSLDGKDEGDAFFISAYCREHSREVREQRRKREREERKECEDDDHNHTSVEQAPAPLHLRSPPPRVLARPFLSPRSAAFTTPPPPIHTSMQSHHPFPSSSSPPLLSSTHMSPFGKRLFHSSSFFTPHSSMSSAYASPSPSPSPSVWASPTSSPFASTTNSPSNSAAAEMDEDDRFTDRRTFHALVESYFRPLTPIDMLRLGCTGPPPSQRSTQRRKEKEKEKERQRQKADSGHTGPAAVTAAATASPSPPPVPPRELTAFPSQAVHESASGLQRRFTSPHSSPVLTSIAAVGDGPPSSFILNSTSSNPPSSFASSEPAVPRSSAVSARSPSAAVSLLPSLPVVPPARDPSFFIPPLATAERSLELKRSSGKREAAEEIKGGVTGRAAEDEEEEEVPRIPQLLDLPHLSVLSGLNVPVLGAHLGVELVSTSDPCLSSPSGPVLITSDKDAWVSVASSSSSSPSSSPSTAPPSTSINYLDLDPHTVLSMSLSPDVRLNVQLTSTASRTDDVASSTAATTSRVARSALLDFEAIPPKAGEAEGQGEGEGEGDVVLRGFVTVEEEDVAMALKQAQDVRDAYHTAMLTMTSIDPAQPITLPNTSQSLPSLDAPSGSSSTSPSTFSFLSPSSESSPDDVLLELVSLQRELACQVHVNVQRRVELSSRIFYPQHIAYRTELSKYHDVVQSTYRHAAAWQTFRHSLRKGMKDADVPRELLLQQISDMAKASRQQTVTTATALPADGSGEVKEVGRVGAADVGDSDEFVVCAVCFDKASPEDNPILYCDRCNLTVHRICYGLQSVPDGDWFCSWCQHQRDRAKQAKRRSATSITASSTALTFASPSPSPDPSYPCALCTHRGGALKPTTDGRWAHILCAMLVPRARLKDVSRMEPVAGLEEALAAQRQHGRVCTVCNIDYGCCASCSHKQCNTVFHPHCGWLSGFYYQADVQGIDIRFSIFCIAEGTPVELAEGVSVPIEAVEVGALVLGLSDSSPAALVDRAVTAVHSRGVRDCIELLFSDGRTLTCTPDHRILTSNGSWVPAGDLEVGTAEVSTGPTFAVTRRADVRPSDAKWSHNVRDSLGFVLSVATAADSARACAFARLVGVGLTDASIVDSADRCTLFLHHQLDVSAVRRDLRLLSARVPATRCGYVNAHAVYEQDLPAEVCAAFATVGLPIGDRADRVVCLPALFTRADCPTVLVREFVGGLFGGSATACHRPFSATSHTPTYAQLKSGRVAGAQLAEWRSSLTLLLTRCGLAHDDLVYELQPSQRDGLRVVQLRFSADALRSFAAGVGYRYSVQEAQSLTAAAVLRRCVEKQDHDTQLVKEPAAIDRKDGPVKKGELSVLASDAFLFRDAALYDGHTVVSMRRARVVAVRRVGPRRTFDLTVHSPPGVEPAFTANGVVVHNCAQHTPEHALAKVKVPSLSNFSSSPSNSPSPSPIMQPTPSSTISIAPISLTPFSNLPSDSQSWVSGPSLLSFFPIPAGRLPPLPPQPNCGPSPVALKRQDSTGSTGGLSPLFSPAAFATSPSSPFQLSYPREYLIELRLYQQRDIRNRAREDQRTKDTKKKRKRMERRRLERSRALHEDLYQPARCAVCFHTDTELLEKRSAAQAMKGKLEKEKRLHAKSSWAEVLSQAPASAYPTNRLLRCEQCQIDVHQACMGVTDEALAKMRATRAAVVAEKAEEGDDVEGELATSGFLCHRCALSVRDVSCCLCPRKGGCLKPMVDSDGKWIHLACALWTEEVHFNDLIHLEGIEGVSLIPKSKKRLRCCLCKRGGPCVPCSEPGCAAAMHPTCALFAGCFMQLYQKTRYAPTPTFRRLHFCPRHTPIHLARHVDVPSSFTQLTKLRSHFDTARLLLDLIKRREKIKLALLNTEFDIQQEKWRVTRDHYTQQRLASVTALPASDNKFRLRLNKTSSMLASPSSTAASASPVPWYAREGEVDLAVTAAEKVEEMSRMIEAMGEGPAATDPDTADQAPSGAQEAEDEAKEAPAVQVRKTGRARRSSTLLDSSVLATLTPKRRSSQPSTPSLRGRKPSRLGRGAGDATPSAAAALEEESRDGGSGPPPFQLDDCGDDATAPPAVAPLLPSPPAAPPSSEPETRLKRQKTSNSPSSSSSQPSPPPPLPPPPAPQPSEDATAAPTPRAERSKRGSKRKSADSAPQPQPSPPPLVLEDSSPRIARPAPPGSAKRGKQSARKKSTEEGSDKEPTPVTAVKGRKGDRRGKKVDEGTAAPSSPSAAPSVDGVAPLRNGASPSPPAKRRALTVQTFTSASASPSAAGPKPPLTSFSSCSDHSLAPFALHSSVRVLQDMAYYNALIYAIDHSRDLALAVKKEGGADADVHIPRGFQWSIGEVSRRSVVKQEEEWAYFVHYTGWNKRFDEWVVGSQVKSGTVEGEEASTAAEGGGAAESARGGKGRKRGRSRGAAVAFVTAPPASAKEKAEGEQGAQGKGEQEQAQSTLGKRSSRGRGGRGGRGRGRGGGRGK